jgi:hypothetical protein
MDGTCIPKQAMIKCAAKEMREGRGRGGKSHKRGRNRLIPNPWSEEKEIITNGDLFSTSRQSAGG